MYQYHYCIPLMIGTMAFGAAPDLFARKRERQIVAVLAIAAAAFGFWLWSPSVYGTPPRSREASVWSRTWTDGNAEHQSRRASHWESVQAGGA
jgi:dolichyl-phosphate-mannose--protein O-mannosyl transferase